jgi:tetratricopeptide (TPR) repeat protein
MGEETSSINEGDQSVSSKMDICNDDGTVEEILSCGNQLRSMPMNPGQIFNPWLAVDVIGSPRLTGLIGALTLELCNGFADLDLSAPYPGEDEDKCDLLGTDESVGIAVSCTTRAPQTLPTTRPGFSFHIPAFSTQFPKGCHPRMVGPLDELYPFPKVGQRRRLSKHPRSDHLVDKFSLEGEELRCRTKLKELNNMTPSRIIDLVESMRSVAQRYYELECWRLAETWWRRVITCSLGIPGYQPAKLLYACLWVIESIRLQGRIFEAMNLHRDLHQKILQLVSSENELAIFSKRILINFHNIFGEHQSELVISREILQTCLLRYGVRDTLTLEAMLRLGDVLDINGQRKEADAILRTQVNLEGEISAHAERDFIETQMALYAMTCLVCSLRKQGRYDDSGSVLDIAEGQFRHMLQIENSWCWQFYYQKASLLEAKGQLLESEEILRAILRQAPSHPDWDIMHSMILLGNLLRQTGRRTEEATWKQNTFLMKIEMYGIDYKYFRWGCKDLGFCYADLGRYDDAVYHFHQTIEKLALCQGGDSDDRASYIEKIREWIYEVEERRKEDEGWETQSSLNEGSETQSILGEDAHENLTGKFSLDKSSFF